MGVGTGMGTTYDVRAVRAHFPALAAGCAALRRPRRLPGARRGRRGRRRHAAVAAGQPRLRHRGGARGRRDRRWRPGPRWPTCSGPTRGGVVFGRSMTALTFDLARTLAATWGPGDEVVVTRLDHDANIRPWVLRRRGRRRDGALGRLRPAHRRAHRGRRGARCCRRAPGSSRSPAASNLLGTRPPVRAIADLGARGRARWCYVDGVHCTAHAAGRRRRAGRGLLRLLALQVPRPALRCARRRPGRCWRRCTPQKLLPSTDAVPERFELGTLPYELLAGTTAAVDFLAASRTGRDRRPAGAADRRRWPRWRRTRTGCGTGSRTASAELPGVVVYSRAAAPHADAAARRSRAATRRTPTGSWPSAGVNAPAGSFYALEASRRLGLGDTGRAAGRPRPLRRRRRRRPPARRAG